MKGLNYDDPHMLHLEHESEKLLKEKAAKLDEIAKLVKDFKEDAKTTPQGCLAAIIRVVYRV